VNKLALVLVLAIITLTVAGWVITRDDQPESQNITYPSPPPVTFIPPTPLPLPTATPDPRLGQPLPEVTFDTLDGEPIRLRDLEGQIVFLNFWATWCDPCRAEMSLLQRLQDEHGEEGVRVIALTDPLSGQTEDDIREFVDSFDLTLTVALSSDLAFYDAVQVWQIPTTIIMDRRGIVRFIHVGELHPEDIGWYLDRLNAG